NPPYGPLMDVRSRPAHRTIYARRARQGPERLPSGACTLPEREPDYAADAVSCYWLANALVPPASSRDTRWGQVRYARLFLEATAPARAVPVAGGRWRPPPE